MAEARRDNGIAGAITALRRARAAAFLSTSVLADTSALSVSDLMEAHPDKLLWSAQEARDRHALGTSDRLAADAVVACRRRRSTLS